MNTEKLKEDFTINHEYFQAVQGAEVIRLTDGTEFVRRDVATKIMAKFKESELKERDLQIAALKEALGWALSEAGPFRDDLSCDLYDKYRKLL